LRTIRYLTYLCCAISLIACLAKPVLAGEPLDSETVLGLSADDQTSVTTYNSPRPASKIAENITVITSEQIARLNAHTLADVLNTVSGFQLSGFRTPGGDIFTTAINGVIENHLLLLLDGVPQNDIKSNRPFFQFIPAGIIERVEVIKGAASSGWGPALGGVVNVVTKSPDNQRGAGGILSGSYGEKNTSDLNAETSGTLDKFGYYLYGGNLHSSGLRPGTRLNGNNLFTKLTYNLPSRGLITLSGKLLETSAGIEESATLDFKDTQKIRNYATNLNLLQPLTTDLTLLIIADIKKERGQTVFGQITYDPPYMDYRSRQQNIGSKAELTWRKDDNSLTAGAEYRNIQYSDNLSWSGAPDIETVRNIDRINFYLNGSLELGRLTLLPGVRFDHTGNAGDNTSYALGSTYKLTDKTIVRAYGGDGFGLPRVDKSSDLQKIWTVQTGIESGEIPYIWLKGTLFYNRMSSVEVQDSNGNLIGRKEVRQGYEVELKTVPLFNLSASAGYTWINSYVPNDSNQQILDAPTNTLKLSLDYNNRSTGSSALLLGNYIWWNGHDSTTTAHYKPVTWDLLLNQKLWPDSEHSPELFFSGHNLFNGAQYTNSLYMNPNRWIEGGVRFKF
jgi:vitamin B12 transporter